MNEWIQRAWGVPLSDRFPGPQPISIERKHFPLLKKQPYVVCEKTDGVRYLLVCDAAKQCALVDRAFHIIYISMNIPRGTILDGELVNTRQGKHLFIVHDAVVVRDENLINCTLTERLEKAKSVVQNIVRTPKSPFQVVIKQMIPLEKISLLPQEFPYETDGLVFTPVNEPIRSGTHETLFKWKPRNKITIDFQVHGRDLYIQERGQLIKETEIHHVHNYPPGTIVECAYGESGWSIVKVRTDKTYPNNRRTFLRTIVNLRENIQYDEFKVFERDNSK